MYFVRPSLLIRKLYNKAIWQIPTDEKIIYLTFDDGPTPEVTSWVMDTLRKYKAKATFFCVGSNVSKYPDIFRQIVSEKHSIGNHTFNHLNGWKTKTKEYLDNVERCDSLIQQQIPGTEYQVSKIFRPPYGRMRQSQYSGLNTKYSLIMWDVLSGDFDKKISQEKCFHNVITKTRKGSIVVFHDSIKAMDNLSYTLPKFLKHFNEQGFYFRSL